MVLKRYAQIIGVVLILVGIVGLVLGNQLFLGILNIDIVEDVVHLVTGGIYSFTWASLGPPLRRGVRNGPGA